MIYLGNGMYSSSGPNNSLMHYGVIGMKWGIRKDHEFRSDLNWHESNKKIRRFKELQRQGKLTKKQRKMMVKDIVKKTNAKNKAMWQDYKSYKPNKNGKISDIYSINKQKALDTIPHYKAKHMGRRAIKIAGLGTAGVPGHVGTTADYFIYDAIGRRIFRGQM